MMFSSVAKCRFGFYENTADIRHSRISGTFERCPAPSRDFGRRGSSSFYTRNWGGGPYNSFVYGVFEQTYRGLHSNLLFHILSDLFDGPDA
jgi:hypothetical protein